MSKFLKFACDRLTGKKIEASNTFKIRFNNHKHGGHKHYNIRVDINIYNFCVWILNHAISQLVSSLINYHNKNTTVPKKKSEKKTIIRAICSILYSLNSVGFWTAKVFDHRYYRG